MAAIGFSYGEKGEGCPLLSSKFLKQWFTERLVVTAGQGVKRPNITFECGVFEVVKAYNKEGQDSFTPRNAEFRHSDAGVQKITPL